MNDVKCPYCDKEIDINHDDGYGYEENDIYSQECSGCGKTFAYTTRISIDHEAFKADCLNGGGHEYEKTNTYPERFARMRCNVCGEEKELPIKE